MRNDPSFGNTFLWDKGSTTREERWSPGWLQGWHGPGFELIFLIIVYIS